METVDYSVTMFEENFTSTVATLMKNVSDVMATDNREFCGDRMDDFHTHYKKIHNYLSLVVCIFGCIANILNIVVLTRPEMRSPTNAILTGLAIADFFVMVDYIPFALYSANITPTNENDKYSYGWVTYILLHASVSQILHTISIFLTVILAIWRYIAVGFPQKNREWCNMNITIWSIVSSYIITPIISIPIYLTMERVPQQKWIFPNGTLHTNLELITPEFVTEHQLQNVTFYRISNSELSSKHPALLQVTFLIYGVLIKLIPCVALTFLSIRLIAALLEAKRRRKMLTGNKPKKTLETNGDAEDAKSLNQKKQRKNSKILDKERQTDRTTRMLLAVLFLFLVTEFPQGILGLLNAIYGMKFYLNCYSKLGDLMDVLALINSAINFILYCAMSRQFRKTFSVLFRPKFLPLSQIGEDIKYNRTEMGGRKNGLPGHMTQITQV